MARPALAERNEQIVAAHDAGAGLSELARQHGVTRARIKQIVERERRKRMPEPAVIAKHLDTFVAVEDYLRAHTDARTDKPAQLPIPADEPVDAERWQCVTYLLIERGWRVATDDQGELWFFAPGPLTDPGDVARNLN